MSIFASVQVPFASAASFSSTGESVRHGPHQVAQKSTRTGAVLERAITSFSKVLAVTSSTEGPAMGGRA
jgi:hypothetical protein